MTIEGIQKGYLFGQKWYVKRVRVAQGGASPCKTLSSTPPPARNNTNRPKDTNTFGYYFADKRLLKIIEPNLVPRSPTDEALVYDS